MSKQISKGDDLNNWVSLSKLFADNRILHGLKGYPRIQYTIFVVISSIVPILFLMSRVIVTICGCGFLNHVKQIFFESALSTLKYHPKYYSILNHVYWAGFAMFSLIKISLQRNQRVKFKKITHWRRLTGMFQSICGNTLRAIIIDLCFSHYSPLTTIFTLSSIGVLKRVSDLSDNLMMKIIIFMILAHGTASALADCLVLNHFNSELHKNYEKWGSKFEQHPVDCAEEFIQTKGYKSVATPITNNESLPFKISLIIPLTIHKNLIWYLLLLVMTIDVSEKRAETLDPRRGHVIGVVSQCIAGIFTLMCILSPMHDLHRNAEAVSAQIFGLAPGPQPWNSTNSSWWGPYGKPTDTKTHLDASIVNWYAIVAAMLLIILQNSINVMSYHLARAIGNNNGFAHVYANLFHIPKIIEQFFGLDGPQRLCAMDAPKFSFTTQESKQNLRWKLYDNWYNDVTKHDIIAGIKCCKTEYAQNANALLYAQIIEADSKKRLQLINPLERSVAKFTPGNYDTHEVPYGMIIDAYCELFKRHMADLNGKTNENSQLIIGLSARTKRVVEKLGDHNHGAGFRGAMRYRAIPGKKIHFVIHKSNSEQLPDGTHSKKDTGSYFGRLKNRFFKKKIEMVEYPEYTSLAKCDLHPIMQNDTMQFKKIGNFYEVLWMEAVRYALTSGIYSKKMGYDGSMQYTGQTLGLFESGVSPSTPENIKSLKLPVKLAVSNGQLTFETPNVISMLAQSDAFIHELSTHAKSKEMKHAQLDDAFLEVFKKHIAPIARRHNSTTYRRAAIKLIENSRKLQNGCFLSNLRRIVLRTIVQTCTGKPYQWAGILKYRDFAHELITKGEFENLKCHIQKCDDSTPLVPNQWYHESYTGGVYVGSKRNKRTFEWYIPQGRLAHAAAINRHIRLIEWNSIRDMAYMGLPEVLLWIFHELKESFETPAKQALPKAIRILIYLVLAVQIIHPLITIQFAK